MASNFPGNNRKHRSKPNSKPYERPSQSVENCTTSISENSNSKGIINQVKESVSELLSNSWLSAWMQTKDSVEENSRGKHAPVEQSFGDHEKETFFDDDDESSCSSHSNLKPSPHFKQIYPEEGELAAIPSTSKENKIVLLMSEKHIQPQFPKPEFPLISSTPTSSLVCGNSINDQRKTFFIESGQSNGCSLDPIKDVSVIAPVPGSEYHYNRLSDEGAVPQITNVCTPTSTSAFSNSSTSKKRFRYSYNGRETGQLSNDGMCISRLPSNNDETSLQDSFSHNQSLPQEGALASKRPRFSISAYGTPLNSSSALTDSSYSIFYPGKTMYGGAANYKKNRGSAPNRILQRLQIKPQPAHEEPAIEDGGLSLAAKRILDCLDKMTTPLSEAKRIPTLKKRSDYFESPTYIADFHKHRPMPQTPPLTKLLTPSQVNIKDNLASFIEKQSMKCPTLEQEKSNDLMTNQNGKDLSPTVPQQKSTQIPSYTIAKSGNVLPLPLNSSSFNQPSSSLQIDKMHSSLYQSKMLVRKTKKSSGESFKITTKRGISNIDNSPLEQPNLPAISLPLSSIPKIDFGCQLPLGKPFDPLSSSEVENFSFSYPEVLGDTVVNAGSEEESSTEYIFSNPLIEKEESTTADFKSVTMSTSSTDLDSVANIMPPRLSGIINSSKNNDAAIVTPTTVAINSTTTPLITFTDWGDQFKPVSGSWECNVCCIMNKNNDTHCIACGAVNAKSMQPMTLPTKPNNTNMLINEVKNTTITASCSVSNQIDTSFGKAFIKSSNEWACDICMINNKNSAEKCQACQSNKPSTNNKPNSVSTVLPLVSSPGFGSQFAMNKSEWECGTCLIRNKEILKKCIACDTPRDSLSQADVGSEIVTGNFKFGSTTTTASTGQGFSFTQTQSGPVINNDEFIFGIQNKAKPNNCTEEFKFGVPNKAGPISSTKEFKFGVQSKVVPNSSTNKFEFALPAKSKGADSPISVNSTDSKRKSYANVSSSFLMSRKIEENNDLSSTTNKESMAVPLSFGSSASTSKFMEKATIPIFSMTKEPQATVPNSSTNTDETPSISTFNAKEKTPSVARSVKISSLSSEKTKPDSVFSFTPVSSTESTLTTSEPSDVRSVFTSGSGMQPSKNIFQFGNTVSSTSSVASAFAFAKPSGFESISKPGPIFDNKTIAFGNSKTQSSNSSFKKGDATSKPSIFSTAFSTAFSTTSEKRELSVTSTAPTFSTAGSSTNMFCFGSSNKDDKTKASKSSLGSFTASPTTTKVFSSSSANSIPKSFSFAPQTEISTPSSALFAFGQPQDKKPNSGLIFGQSPNNSGSNINFSFGSQKSNPALFQFRQPKMNLATTTKKESASISNSQFSLPISNPFTLPTTNPEAPQQSRVIRKAIRRTKK